MSKQEFLISLSRGLAFLPQGDSEERINFYSEMIDDSIEEGLTEQEAVAKMGSVDDVIAQILADTPLTILAKEKLKPNKALRVWEIVLLVLGSPIWLSLLIAALAIILSVYVVLWSVIISLRAVDVSLAACFLGGVAAAGVLAGTGNTITAVAILGAALTCAGLSIFLFFGCKAATKGVLILAKKIVFWIKSLFVRGNKGE